MRAIDPADAFNDRTCQHARFAQQLQSNTGADDINNRIDRADFMEMHFFRRQAMNFSFGDGDAIKDRERFLLHPGGKCALGNQFADLTEGTAMRIRVLVIMVVWVVVVMLFDELDFAFFRATIMFELERGFKFVRFGQFFSRLQITLTTLEFE